MTTIGGLSNYIQGYTHCIDSCDPYYSDKTNRLGYDNTRCLLSCNKYYTSLRQEGIPDPYKSLNNRYTSVLNFCKDFCKGNIDCEEKCYQQNQCIKQCNIDSKFMTLDNKNKCIKSCYKQY